VKKGMWCVAFLVCLMIEVNSVMAHPGRTDANGCHVCKTNCASWGLKRGEYHCHNGNSSSSSSSSSRSNIKSSTAQRNIYVKSGNNNLGSVSVDGHAVAVSDNMTFTTNNSNPNIIANVSHSKATVSINKPDYLLHGNNYISIVVTAENGSAKTYKLNIKLISNDATLKRVKVGKKSVDISDEMTYKTKKKTINLKVSANSTFANVNYDKKHKLKIGDNIIPIKVVAEDGTTKEYKLNVIRERKLSRDVGVTITINDKKVKFKDYKSKTIYINNNVDKIKIDYKLSNKNAKIKLNYDKKIKIGNTKIKFVVKAESGKRQEYIIKLHKYNKFEQLFHN